MVAAIDNVSPVQNIVFFTRDPPPLVKRESVLFSDSFRGLEAKVEEQSIA